MKLTAILVGVSYAVICEGLAFTMVGGGHGWLTPFVWGPLGLILFPLCFYAALSSRENQSFAKLSIVLAIVAAAGANTVLVARTLDEGLEYFDRLGGFAYVWVAFWVGGQLPLLYAIARRALDRRTPREA